MILNKSLDAMKSIRKGKYVSKDVKFFLMLQNFFFNVFKTTITIR